MNAVIIYKYCPLSFNLILIYTSFFFATSSHKNAKIVDAKTS